MQEQSTAFFISDAHFGVNLTGCEDREKHFFTFLDTFKDQMSSLYIIGDLFDFWIEYKRAIRPDYFHVLYHLRKAIDHGVEIHYLAGNHDFALGSFLSEQLGVHIHEDHYQTVIQNRKVHLYHGDGLLKRDKGYRILKRILRNKTNQFFYKLLHPDIGVKLGTGASGSSRKYQERYSPEFREMVKREYRENGIRYLQNGTDIVLFGHSHNAELVRCDKGIYCNTGAWLIHYNYATMHDGELKLWTYPPTVASPIEIPAVRD